MPRVESIDIRRVRLAEERHTTGWGKVRNNENLHKVFDRVVFYVARGQKIMTYNELAEDLDFTYSRVRYYFDKLKYYGAIKLEEA